MKKIVIIAALVLGGISSFGAETKQQPATTVQQNIVMVERTGASRFFGSTGKILNGALKVLALPFEWAADGLDAIAPNEYVPVQVVPAPVVPVVTPPPVVAPPAVIVNHYPSYNYGGYGYGYPPPPPPRYYYRGY